jgi:flagellar biosynthesis/type III secretory pathway protein FliH
MSRVLKAGGDLLDLAAASQRDGEAQELERQLAEAFEAGRAAGTAEGRARAESESSAAVQRASAALDRLTQDSGASAQVQDRQDEVLRAALEIAEWVLREELSANGYAMLQRLESAMSSLLPDRETTVLVSEIDATLVRDWAKGMHVQVVVDASLAPGDALVRTSHGGADVTVAAALQLASDVLGLPAQQVAAQRVAAQRVAA